MRRSPTSVHEAGALIEVHLMIERPERHLRDFVSAGADSVTIHAEATPHLAYAANVVHELGAVRRRGDQPRQPRRGAAAELTGAFRARAVHDRQPGLGRPAIHRALAGASCRGCARSSAIRSRSRSTAASTPHTAPRCAAAGARLFVAGSAIFGARDPGEAYLEIARSVSAPAESGGVPRR